MEESSTKKLTPSHITPLGIEKISDNQIDQDIYQKLFGKENGEQMANAFLGAIKVLQDQDNPDRLAQAANSIRGIGYLMIRDIELPIETIEGEAKEEEEDNRHKAKLELLLVKLDPAGGTPDYLKDSVTDSWTKLHRWFNRVAHHTDPESRKAEAKEFTTKFGNFKDLLVHLLQDHFSTIDEIDELLKIERPTQKDFNKLSLLIFRDHESYKYFFEKADLRWLDVLNKQESIFKKPPLIRRDGQYIIAPIWPESQYLARMAKQNPDLVINIIKKSPKVDNPRVYEDFVRAAIEMPPQKAASLVGLIAKQNWLYLPYSISLPTLAEQLFSHLFDGGEKENAMKLADRLFDLTSTVRDSGNKRFRFVDVKAYYDNWHYDILLDKVLEKVTPSTELKFLEILSFKLEDAVMLEQKGRTDKRSIDDLSHISRPFIHEYKEKSQNPKESLISAIIDFLDAAAGNDLKKLKLAVDFLSRFKFQVFRRIELHYFKEFPDLFDGNIKNILTKKFFYSSDSYGLRREFIPLLGQEYNKLSTPDKNKILRILWLGPTIRNRKLNKAEVRKLRDLWLWHYLDPLQDKLPAPWKAKYRMLARKFGGNPPKDEGLMRTWSGPTSPLTANQLKSKTAKEILEYLKIWEPEKDEFGVPSPEGLGRLFQETVKDRINEFTELASEFIDYKMRFVYMYHFVHGLQNAFKETKQLQQWDKVIDFMEKISKFSDEEIAKFPTKSDDRFEIDWNNLIGEINYFLRDVLFTQEETIPFEYREKVWNIIQRGLKNPSPKPEDEKREEENSRDFGTMSINTVRGKAMHAAMAYAVWCSRNLKLEKQDNRLAPENTNVNASEIISHAFVISISSRFEVLMLPIFMFILI